MAADSARKYPVACPGCAETKGYPYLVRTVTDQSGAIEVKLRCRECGHEWVEIVANSN